MNYLGLTLLWCAIQVTIFAVASAALYLSMRKRSPAARSTVLATSLVSVILLTCLAWSPWPRWVPESSPRPATTNASQRVVPDLASNSEPSVRASSQMADTSEGTTLLFLENLWDEMKHAPAPPVADTKPAWSWQTIVAGLFLGIFAMGLARLLSGVLAVRRYRTRSKPIRSVELNLLLEELQLKLECTRPVKLRFSREVNSPATIGWRIPIILLPAEWQQWSQQERVAVIAHEVAHIKRFDFPAWFAAQVGVVLHFYHPVVHWLAGRLRLEQELAADAAAAEVLGGNSNYLHTLAGMALRRDARSLSWAARTFLPTGHTFIRRIEMLRRRKALEIRVSSLGRILLAGLMLCAALFAAGWRSPFEEVAVAQQPEGTTPPTIIRSVPDTLVSTQTGTVTAAAADPLSLAYVPRDSLVVLAVRPSSLLAQPVLAPIKKVLDEQDGLQELFGIDVRQLQQVSVTFLPEERPGMADDPALILHFSQDINQQELLKTWLRDWEEKDLGELKYYETRRRIACAFPDRRTAIVAQKSGDVIRILAAGEKGAAKANWITAWDRVSMSHAAAMLNLEQIRPALNEGMDRGPQGAMLGTFSPLWQDGKRLVWGLTAAKSLDVELILECEEGKAERVKETITATFVLARNSLSALRAEAARRGGDDALMALKAADLADGIIDRTKFDTEGDIVSGTLTLGEETGEIVTLLLPAITQARVAAKRTQSMNNLKQIGLAMHNYHDVYKHLPPAVVMGPDGKTPHSWRVEILPYIDQFALYQEYRMNEPWDSDHNKKLLEKIPDVFRCPSDASDSTNTSYFALTGKGTSFEGDEGLSFAKFTDGLSNTFMVVETKNTVPWTKPEDIPIDFEKDLPEFGGWYQGGYIALMCDGAVKFISENIDEKVLKLLIQRNDGQPLPTGP